MKLLVLFCIILPLNCILAQQMGLFYGANTNAINKTTFVQNNSELLMLDLRQTKDAVTNQLAVVSFNQDLESTEYRYFDIIHNGSSYSYLNLLGAACLNDLLVVAVLDPTSQSSQNQLRLIQIDLSTNQMTSSVLPEIYTRFGPPARQKGNELIVYLQTIDGQLNRYAFDITNLSNVSAVSLGSYPVLSNTNLEPSEFKIVNNDEYILIHDYCQNNFIKRTAGGTFFKTTIPYGGFKKIATFDINNNNNAEVITDDSVYIFSTGLSLINKFSFTHLAYSNYISHRHTPMLIFDNKRILYYNTGAVAVYDSNYNLISFEELNTRPNIFQSYTDMNGEKLAFTNSRLLNPFASSFLVPNDFSLNDGKYSVLIFKEGCTSNTLGNKKLSNQNLSFSAGLLSNIFQNSSNQNFVYDTQDSTQGLLYSTRSYMQGFDLSGNFKIERSDAVYRFGPYTDTALFNSLIQDKYRKNYYVTKEMINNHLDSLAIGSTNYRAPEGIHYWPGNGDVSVGQSEIVADFLDRNDNGKYEPYQGDVPKMYGDAMVFGLYHTPNFESDSSMTGETFTPFAVEHHKYIYWFDCDTSEVLSNSVFYKHKVINRGEAMAQYIFSNYMDADIGLSTDDFMGTDVMNNLVYTYNSVEFDSGQNGSFGFGSKIPTVGISILQGAKKNDDFIDNPFGSSIGESVNGIGFGDTITDNEYYGLTSSLIFSNGVTDTNFFYNQFLATQGVDTSGMFNSYGGIPMKHAMISNSDPFFYSSNGVPHSNNYTEFSVGNQHGDRRVLANTGGPDCSIPAGESRTFDFVYTIALDTASPSHLNSVDKLRNDAMYLKKIWRGNTSFCGKNFDYYDAPESNLKRSDGNIDFNLYPNPTYGYIYLDDLEVADDAMVRIYNLAGAQIKAMPNSSHKLIIDCNAFESGMYLLNYSANGKSKTKKFVISK